MREKWKWDVRGSFCILLSVLLFLDEQNIVPWALLACLLHELGHLSAIYMLGGRVRVIRLSAVGAEIVPTRQAMFSYVEEIIIIAAGPITSLLVALLGAYLLKNLQSEVAFLFCGLNLMAGLFNLLPVGPLDGGRLLRIMIAKHCHTPDSDRIYQCITACFAGLLLYLGFFYVVKLSGNITLIVTGVWLLSTLRHQNGYVS